MSKWETKHLIHNRISPMAEHTYGYVCSGCNYIADYTYVFCPNCGHVMENGKTDTRQDYWEVAD